MILYLSDTKNSTRELLHLRSKMAGYKINSNKSVAFLYSKDNEAEQDELSIMYIYASNASGTIFVKGTLLKLKVHIKLHSVIVEDFKTTFSQME